MIKTKSIKTEIGDALINYIKTQDDPPAQGYSVDKRTLKSDKKDPSLYTAQVTNVIAFNNHPRKHTYKCKFKYDSNTKEVDPASFAYL